MRPKHEPRNARAPRAGAAPSLHMRGRSRVVHVRPGLEPRFVHLRARPPLSFVARARASLLAHLLPRLELRLRPDFAIAGTL